jgi:methyl-accepting chemotaxis protein
MAEQSQAAAEISRAIDDGRKQSEGLTKAMMEQAKALKEMTTASTSSAKNIGLITRSNREHSAAAGSILSALHDIREVTAQNTEGAKNTLRGTRDLIETVEDLVSGMKQPNRNGNTKRTRNSRGRLSRDGR